VIYFHNKCNERLEIQAFSVLLIILFQEAWLNSLVTAEVVFWFFIGECIGKRSIAGYHV
jgi:hypothetical protein